MLDGKTNGCSIVTTVDALLTDAFKGLLISLRKEKLISCNGKILFIPKILIGIERVIV